MEGGSEKGGEGWREGGKEKRREAEGKKMGSDEALSQKMTCIDIFD